VICRKAANQAAPNQVKRKSSISGLIQVKSKENTLSSGLNTGISVELMPKPKAATEAASKFSRKKTLRRQD
jgi:hypothetical protein